MENPTPPLNAESEKQVSPSFKEALLFWTTPLGIARVTDRRFFQTIFFGPEAKIHR